MFLVVKRFRMEFRDQAEGLSKRVHRGSAGWSTGSAEKNAGGLIRARLN